MKLITQLVVLVLVSLSLSGCIGENEIATLNEPSWINDAGDGNATWSISLSSSEWLEINSTYAQVIHWDENGDGTREEHLIMAQFTISEDEQGWLVPGFSPIFGGNYSACYIFQNECYQYHSWGDQGFEVLNWSIIYRVHEV